MQHRGLLEQVNAFSAHSIPMHMPGHKRNFALAPYIRDLGGSVDVTELSETDDLYLPTSMLRESMALASEMYKVKHSFYLVNGASCGILAGIFALIREGDTVIAARNCHISVWHALMLRKAKVLIADCAYDDDFHIALGPSKETIEALCRAHEDVKLLIVTSPSYEGVIADIASVSALCKKKGIKLLVDGAHGAHLGLHPLFPEHALMLGADMEIKSLHKTLPALGQTALMQTNDTALFEKALGYVRMFQTSSPSFVLLSSIDSCMRLIKNSGDHLFKRWQGFLHYVRRNLQALANIRLLANVSGEFTLDASKLFIHQKGGGGGIVSALKERGVYPEFYGEDFCLLMTGLTERAAAAAPIVEALHKADQRKTGKEKENLVFLPKLFEMDYRHLPDCEEEIAPDDATGRRVSEFVYAYPPGIPAFLPGTEIRKEHIPLLKKGKKEGLRFSKSGKSDKIFVYGL